MSYQVLARKWRPSTFAELVGQEHVLQALVNALDNNRLHHAYLFTGTRGVGKTTIARIVARALNCETGVTSTPCGECSACREIAEGRFVDLIEVDAASRTKVEDTRELLDNVQYAPTRGRYKIYLIDEVHMLSSHSFNALLKTLEEPPPHVKFLLATTDPQKLPVTILSRCLQFNLKNLSPERIVGHLQHVLGEEQIPFEDAGIWALARAADGSMRDALSLTDQAIAHGGGQVNEAEVNAMLGTIERGYVLDICSALAEGSGSAVLAAVARMAEQSPDYDAALADLLSIWHQVAIAQTVPDALDQGVAHYREIIALAGDTSREDVQLFYQVALMGRQDLRLSPDMRAGFEMVMLRALAFRPQQPGTPGKQQRPQEAVAQVKKPEAAPAPVKEPAAETSRAAEAVVGSADQALPPPWEEVPADLQQHDPGHVDTAPVPPRTVTPPAMSVSPQKQAVASPVVEPAVKPVRDSAQEQQAPRYSLDQFQPQHWIDLRNQLQIGASLGEIASHCVYLGRQRDCLHFMINRAETSLYDTAHQAGLAKALGDYFGLSLRVEIEFGSSDQETPRAFQIRKKAERLEQAVESMRRDPAVQELVRVFDARLDEQSVQPID